MSQKHIAPLPWIHLNESLRPNSERICIMLDEMPTQTGKNMARLYYQDETTPIQDAFRFLNDHTKLSIRQKECLKVLAYADVSTVKKDCFLLGKNQLSTLLHFAGDINIEVKNIGAIVPSAKPAHIKAKFVKDEQFKSSIQFKALTSTKHLIEEPIILGEKDTYLLDKHLCLYHIDPPLLPNEAEALLSAKPLPLEGLESNQAQVTFEAIAKMGIDLSCTKLVGIKSDKTPVTLRAILTTDMRSSSIDLRLHLVTSFEHEESCDEVEIPAQGFIPPLFPLSSGDKSAGLEKVETHLMIRPQAIEEKARQAVFAIGAVASSTHRGFTAKGQRALEVLASIKKKKNLPEWLLIDEDTLPNIIELPKKPVLSLNKSEFSIHELLASIKLQNTSVAVPINELIQTAKKGGSALLVDDDTVLTFNAGTIKPLEVLSETLNIKSFNKEKKLSFFEAALLSKTLKDHVEVDCNEDIKKKLLAFIPEVTDEDKSLPEDLKTTLRPYQHEAVTWMSQMHRAGIGRLLADDMGLGKTLMVLTLLSKIKETFGQMPNLIVAPTSVIDVWELEAKHHFSNLKVVKWHGPNRTDFFDEIKDADLVVTSYALLRKDINKELAKLKFRYLILDEAQHIKNSRTESWKSAQSIRAEQRLALTGTPIENRVLDLYNIVDLVAPSILGTESQFTSRYANPISLGNQDRMNELKSRLNPLILRRKKCDVENDLPPKIESILKCEMSPEQSALYLEVLKRTKSELKDFIYSDKADRKAQMPLLAALTRLRQICCDPRLLPIEFEQQVPSAKTNLFSEVLQECITMGRRVIVYSQFLKMQDIIHEQIKKLGIDNALWLHGGSKNRADIVKKFQDPNGPQVIVVSLKAGGTGITLTAADTIIYYDPWWNPAILDQAADRAHRIGQTKTVHLIKLVCENSIEEQILKLSESKRRLAEGVLTAQKSGSHSLTMDDIKRLLSNEFDRFDPKGT